MKWHTKLTSVQEELIMGNVTTLYDGGINDEFQFYVSFFPCFNALSQRRGVLGEELEKDSIIIACIKKKHIVWVVCMSIYTHCLSDSLLIQPHSYTLEPSVSERENHNLRWRVKWSEIRNREILFPLQIQGGEFQYKWGHVKTQQELIPGLAQPWYLLLSQV